MTTTATDIWKKATCKLKDQLNEDTFDRWIAGIVPLELSDSVCRLGVSNEIICLWLQKNYQSMIADTLSDLIDGSVTVTFESGHEPPPNEEDEVAEDTDAHATETDASPSPSRASFQSRIDSRDDSESTDAYNRRFTFNTFVIGQNNKFAHAACYAVARNLGRAYNPLFIHGGTGLGKTHLLQAIAHDVFQTRGPKARVEYLSSEEFFNRYIYALQEKRLPRFRNHFRKIDLLLIDDVHFFTGKEQLQEEFFHTFNALYNGHRQVVLTSDRPPHEIGGLEQRLVSRFEWGLTTEIQAPDLETRIAILRKKQAEHTTKLDDNILLWVATRIRSNIRRLEGALIRLVSYASITDTHITAEVAEQLLSPLLDEEKSGMLTVEQIQKAVAEYYDIRVADMTSKKRPQNIAMPRQVAMYFCRQLTSFSSPAIAESFNRNHATVLHAAKSVEKRSNDDDGFRNSLMNLEKRLKALASPS
ncbi:MAG: chromosomal replication initiator protein DnaA [bacterium]